MQTPNPANFSWKELFHRIFPKRQAREKDPLLSLMNENGIVLGRNPKTKDLLLYDGPESVLLVGPARSGKGIGTVVPTAFCWNESAFFFDSTEALFQLTSGYRKRNLHQKVMKFAPMAKPGETLHWNPFAEIRVGTLNEATDADLIASYLLDPEQRMRTEEAQQAFLEHVDAFSLFIRRIVHRHMGQGRLAPSLKDIFLALEQPMNAFTDEERDYIRASLFHYQEPAILENTAVTDFTVGDIVDAKEPVSFYLVSSVKDIHKAQPIEKLFVAVLNDRILERKIDKAEKQKRLLLVLDDFLHLGRMPELPLLIKNAKDLGTLCLLTAQSIEDIEACYKDARFLLDACKVQVYHRPDTNDTAARIVKLLKTQAPDEFQGFQNEDILKLRSDKEILFLASHPPILVDRFRYYLHPVFPSYTEIPPVSMNEEPLEVRASS